jgi:hypothetical protein
MKDEFYLTVIFGTEQIRKFFSKEIFSEREINEYTKFYSFATEAELNAFIYGLEEANGWLDLIHLKGVQIINHLIL